MLRAFARSFVGAIRGRNAAVKRNHQSAWTSITLKERDGRFNSRGTPAGGHCAPSAQSCRAAIAGCVAAGRKTGKGERESWFVLWVVAGRRRRAQNTSRKKGWHIWADSSPSTSSSSSPFACRSRYCCEVLPISHSKEQVIHVQLSCGEKRRRSEHRSARSEVGEGIFDDKLLVILQTGDLVLNGRVAHGTGHIKAGTRAGRACGGDESCVRRDESIIHQTDGRLGRRREKRERDRLGRAVDGREGVIRGRVRVGEPVVHQRAWC